MNQNQNLNDILQDELTNSPEPDIYLDGHNFGDEDLYDFTNVKPSLNLGISDEEEEDDINFDYGYGFDYERVIKERLKIANQEFSNEPVVDKERPTTVSFDTAVKAVDIQKDDPDDKKEVVVVPLNDTVEKKDPDAFMNKIKEAIQRYDEMTRLNETNNEYREENDEIEQYFNVPSNQNNSLVKNSTPSPPSRGSPQDEKSNLQLISKIIDSNQSSNPTKFPSPIPQLSPKINSPELQKSDNNVLVEKDGKFELISADQYTAMEKNKPILPHPPQRPKTSTNEYRRNKLINDKIEISKANGSTRSRNRTKSHSPISKHSTPEYAKDYKSPYQATIKVIKPVET